MQSPHGENNNLQLLNETDSRAKIASIIAPVRGSLAKSHLHGMTVFAVAWTVMATGTN